MGRKVILVICILLFVLIAKCSENFDSPVVDKIFKKGPWDKYYEKSQKGIGVGEDLCIEYQGSYNEHLEMVLMSRLPEVEGDVIEQTFLEGSDLIPEKSEEPFLMRITEDPETIVVISRITDLEGVRDEDNVQTCSWIV